MNPLHILVCVKQVPDPEGPVDAFKVDPESKKVIPVGIAPFINPFDENALEAALQIKDTHASHVTVMSMGEKLAQPVLRKALAAGADDLILLTDPQFKDLDSYSTAYVLSRAIRKLGTYDLILTGRQSSDWGFGVTGLLISEMLHIPGINLARKVGIKDNKVVVEKVSNDGYEVVEAPMPALVTVSNEVGELRSTFSVRALQAASKKPVKVFNAVDLELDHRELMAREVFTLAVFHSLRECAFIDGSFSQEKGENLAIAMKRDGII